MNKKSQKIPEFTDSLISSKPKSEEVKNSSKERDRTQKSDEFTKDFNRS